MTARVAIDDQVACVARELERRRRAVPVLVARGELDQAQASAELEHMRAALRSLEWMRTHRQQLLATFRSPP